MIWRIPNRAGTKFFSLGAGNADIAQEGIIQIQQGPMLIVQRLCRKVTVEQAKRPSALWRATCWCEIFAQRGGHGMSFLNAFDLVIGLVFRIRMLDWYAPFWYI
jgi:hypothetical protein